VGRAFVAVTPVIPARDVEAGLAFYVEKLGFTELWRNGDPADSGAVQREGTREFTALDLDGVGLVFWESAERR
jgi:catechol 2,3-dioxygenase-like lactoylglutathione lyase family enzyme